MASKTSIIEQAANRYGIDPGILYGVWGTESNFGRNRGPSSAGALGDFQFEPATARALGVKLGNFRSEAFGAAKYLSQYKGRGLAGMLAAYNAGPAGNPNNPQTRAYIPRVLKLADAFGGAGLNPGAGGGQQTQPVGPTATPGLTPGPDTTALLQQLLGAEKAVQAPTAGLTTPAYAAHPTTPQGYRGILSAGGPGPGRDLSGLLEAAQGLSGGLPPVSPARTPGDAQNAPARPRSVSAKAGVSKFAGVPVAAWIKPILGYAREHGWQGTVTSGFRTTQQQAAIYNNPNRKGPAAKPGTSNHEGDVFPRGAVDVTNAEQLAAILRTSPYRNRLVWAGSKDPVHFSHPHGGGY